MLTGMATSSASLPSSPLFPFGMVAAHSRSADTAISRPTIAQVGSASSHAGAAASAAGVREHRSTRLVHTITLSATGSRNAPNGVMASHLRASTPSSQSVIAAATKMASAAGTGIPHVAFEQYATPTAGVARTRNQVRYVGIALRRSSHGTVDADADCDDGDAPVTRCGVLMHRLRAAWNGVCAFSKQPECLDVGSGCALTPPNPPASQLCRAFARTLTRVKEGRLW
mmetsp:Transcript_9305/g.25037  ORF Transcript_9305/g.25037 Transcript_9305/m.25037 type:complete len:227 (+) Transcript_9305:250-930(+)